MEKEKIYTSPELEVVRLAGHDVVCASGDNDTPWPGTTVTDGSGSDGEWTGYY